MVRRVERNGNIVAVAGTGVRGNTGDGGPAARATLNRPRGIALDGNLLYIGDDGNSRVRVMNLQTGTIENYAGSATGARGAAGDGGPAGNATLIGVGALAVDNQGNLLIADYITDRVRRVNKATGVITTFAGNGGFGIAGEGGPATAAQLASPEGLAVDADGSVYISNLDSGRTMKVEPSGTIRRVAGTLQSVNTSDGVNALDAAIGTPSSIALDRAKRVLYICDNFLGTIRGVDLTTGLINTVAGAAFAYGFTADGQPARTNRLGAPWGIALDAQGQLAFSDRDNYRVRRVRAEGLLETLAGRPPYAGDGGPATQALLFQPANVIPDGAGGMYIADSGNCVIRQVTRAGVISTFAGTPSVCSSSTNTDGRPARQAVLNFPIALARDQLGNVYVSEGSRIRKIAVDGGSISTVASSLRLPGGLAIDNAQQFLYVAETTGNRITRIDLSNNASSVFSGSVGGTAGFVDNVASATDARYEGPTDLAFDRQGNLFIADSFNFRIRRIEPSGRVTTVAGNGTAGPASEGAATEIGIGAPTGIAVDQSGTVYFTSLQRVMQLRAGRITTLAGDPAGGFAGDGGFGAQARFNVPYTVRVDGTTLLVADEFNHRIRALTPVRAATVALSSGDGQSASVSTEPREPLVVQVRLSDGSPVPGVPVTFAASGGTLSAARVITEGDGRAATRLTMPATAGPVTVTATVEDLPSVRFSLTANPAVSPTRPRVSSVITAGAFGAAARIAPGTWMELYGANLATATRQWAGEDFQGTQAPTSLGGVRVTVAGRPAFVQLISPGQINAQVPDGIGTGLVDVQVTNAEGTSETFRVTAAERAPALLAPPAFNVGGKQYVAALHADGAFVGPENLIAGAAFRPARAGDRVVLYGIGFGAVAPAVPAGQVVGVANALPGVTVSIGGVRATVEYGGLAGGFVGLYQFNVAVPAGVAAGDAALAVSAGGVAVEQPLVLTVRE